MKKTVIAFSFVIGLGLALFAQAPRALTNQDVIGLVKAGIPEQVIIAKIQNSPTAFDTNPKALERLKATGIPEPIMMAMVDAPVTRAPAVAKSNAEVASVSAAPQATASGMPAIIQTTKPVVVVQQFTVKHGVPWPYDPKQMQLQTIAELMRKDGKRFFVVKAANPEQPRLYTLHGKILDWHPGNRAKRMFIGFGSGRESAKIRYWLTNANGKQIFKHTDTIRSSFWASSAATGSAGTLGEPFADKIAQRLKHAKLH